MENLNFKLHNFPRSVRTLLICHVHYQCPNNKKTGRITVCTSCLGTARCHHGAMMGQEHCNGCMACLSYGDNNSVPDLETACCHYGVMVSHEHCCDRTSCRLDALPDTKPTAPKHYRRKQLMSAIKYYKSYVLNKGSLIQATRVIQAQCIKYSTL